MTDRQRALQIKRLEACLAKPENRECFDCSALRPRWASTNLGIFMCMRCAGVHRSLGVHISKVKSINMDLWEEDMIRNCETIGNGPEGKFRYEANMPATVVKPKMTTDDREVERHIRMKFESKVYYPRPDQARPDASAPAAEPTRAERPLASTPSTGSGKVVQAVAVKEDEDLFGQFAQARVGQAAFGEATSAPPAQGTPVTGASHTGTDFFGGGGGGAAARAPAAAPAPTPAAAPDPFAAFAGAPAAPQPAAPAPVAPAKAQAGPTDFFGAAQPAQPAGQADFFAAGGPPQPARPPMPQHSPDRFHSMYQQPATAPPKQLAPATDPFSVLATERPKTPPKHTPADVPTLAQPAPHHAPDPFAAPPSAPVAAAPAAPAASKKNALDDLFA